MAQPTQTRPNLWPFDSFIKTTHRHVRSGEVTESRERYKGYTLFKHGDGTWEVPQIDRDSRFDDKREVKRFVDQHVKDLGEIMRKNPGISADSKGIEFVIGIRGEGARRTSEVQSVIFDKGEWGEKKAKAWLKAHGFKSGAMDRGDGSFLRFRQEDPGIYTGFRTIAPGNHRRNPEGDSADMYESFHGAPSEETIEYVEQEHYHGNLAALGTLVELKVRTLSGYDVTLAFESGETDGSSTNPKRNSSSRGPFSSAARLTGKFMGGVRKPVEQFVGTAGKVGGYLDRQLGRVVGNPGRRWPKFAYILHHPGNPDDGTFKLLYADQANQANREAKEAGENRVWVKQPSLKKTNPEAHYDIPEVLLCSSEDGQSLFFVGGDQAVDLSAIHMDGEWEKESMILGECYFCSYFTEKDFDKFQPIVYEHQLAEVTGEYPMLRYDSINKKLYLDGGQYFIKKPLLETSPGIEN